MIGSNDCPLEEVTTNLWRCPLCGYKSTEWAAHNCPGRPLLGDYIARLTRWIGIKPCGGCKKRIRWLNKKHAAVIELVNGLHAAVRRRLKK